MQRAFNRIALLLAVCLAAACVRGKKEAPQPLRPFPRVEIPAVLTDPQERTDYGIAHYWDAYFAGSGNTDSTAVLGVPAEDVEQALANFIGLLDHTSLETAQKGVKILFKGIEAAQKADTSSHVYTVLTEMVVSYLYDPNSPLRDEDYYAPFAAAMGRSSLTPAELRAGYNYQAAVCSLNPRGSVAADFEAQRPDGSTFTLHGIKAENTLLFFSNPGCHACGEIVASLKELDLDPLIASGKLAVVNLYIDDDVNAWLAYVGGYPDSWYNARDPRSAIRNEELYNVRAIPSLYLLDADKRVVLKDADTPKVLDALAKL